MRVLWGGLDSRFWGRGIRVKDGLDLVVFLSLRFTGEGK